MQSVNQVGWFIDPSSSLLPIWLIALGLEAMFLGGTHQVLKRVDEFQAVSQIERAIATVGIGLGYLFLTLSVLRTSYAEYAAFLYLVFRGVEGVAATHIYLKLIRFFQGKGFSSDYLAKAKHLLVVFFVLVLGSYLVVKALVGSPTAFGIQYNLAIVYTIVVATLSALAVRWRYRTIAQELNPGVVGGLALCIAGSQIFAFGLGGDIALSIAGSIVYTIGFWASAYLLLGDIIFDTNDSSSNECPHCHGSLPSNQQAQYCPHCGNAI